MPAIATLDQAVERLYELNVGVVGTGSERHERPHKPVMLLAALDLIAERKASSQNIPWSQELRIRFTAYFEKVRLRDDSDTPENPFFHLRKDQFWKPILIKNGEECPLEAPPLRSNQAFARLADGMENFVTTQSLRARLREAIVARYFPAKRSQISQLFREPRANQQEEEKSARVAEEPEQTAGRNPAFRRKILEIYDYQCAMCGLRIKLPGTDLTFVDGAHLIPFSEGANDHPTNGIALCKNHHWAMDRFLIVPTPDRSDLRWKVSPLLDERRSLGEKMLLEFDNQRILLPRDEAFYPAQESLVWRFKRLLRQNGGAGCIW